MKLNFSRQILPVAAVIAIIVSAYLVLRSQPERTLVAPEATPATAPPAMRDVVAGVGVVEPASELIEISAQIPGVIDRVFVNPGDQVPAGAPLFSIDSRAVRATIGEADARIARLREGLNAARTSLNVAREQLALYANIADPRAVSRQEVIQREGVVADARARMGVAEAEIREAQAQAQSARVALDRHTVRAPSSATILSVEARPGQYASAGPAPGGSNQPQITMGVIVPLHVRIDIDENEIERLALGAPATISPRGAASVRTQATFVRAEPLIVPKRSLTNAVSERVDVRVLQIIYALPVDATGYFVGQQVDGFVPARAARRTARPGR